MSEPLLQIIENLVPTELHAEAWKACMARRWYFGQASREGGLPFWKLDLDGDPTFDSVWQDIRPRCEALAGMPLLVIRQYANGHTYGIDGEPHRDALRSGCFTLLYYPMEEWKSGWNGETLFYDDRGEIVLAVVPRPNRGVFFDSRISHVGRAPSRGCPALRVTVAYKLEATAWQELKQRTLLKQSGQS